MPDISELMLNPSWGSLFAKIIAERSGDPDFSATGQIETLAEEIYGSEAIAQV